MHTQVVLCPDHNDGEYLTRTIRELAALRPEVLSLAIVPVGLTRFRTSCQPLRSFTATEAAAIVSEVAGWQQQFRAETENSFVYLSDEFFLKAGLPIPAEEIYDGYPQLENGIGLVRSFLSDWDATGGCGALTFPPDRAAGRTVIVCGTAFAPHLDELLRSLAPTVQVEAVVNRFFGPAVNVSGLLTGGDIAAHVRALETQPQRLIIPATTLRKGAAVFLDGMTLEELKRIVDVPVLVVDGGAALRQSLVMEG
jgi:putative radical SAM enzyme (TIGR03279 family)